MAGKGAVMLGADLRNIARPILAAPLSGYVGNNDRRNCNGCGYHLILHNKPYDL